MRVGKYNINNGLVIGGAIISTVTIIALANRRRKKTIINSVIEEVEKSTTGTGESVSGWNYTNFFNQALPSGRLIKKQSWLDESVKKIYNANDWFNDDEDDVYDVFSLLASQEHLAQLCKTFNDKYSKDLKTYLNGFLDNSEMSKVYSYVNGLPQFKIKS
jgi:hypothetical protein